MNIKKIKKLIISDRELIQGLILTAKQRDVIQFVQSCKEVTTGDMVKRYECTIQSASAMVAKLVAKGWLKREEKPDPTGGILFIYTVDL